MKWIFSAAAVVIATSVAAGAQSGKSESMPMSKMHEQMTYTGCLESANHGASFLLTHLGENDHGSMKDHMDMNKMPQEHAAADHMMPSALTVKGRDLEKHVGQRVAITGARSHDMSGGSQDKLDTLTVSSLKVVAKSCM
jgi:hypothetical protein